MANALSRFLSWLFSEPKCQFHDGKTFAQHSESEKEADAEKQLAWFI